ncbi:hypothetical protein [Dawidia soli]|uniref:Uncharacterized protein n=1 Tax=Dawidia soli TaxID=2782352 RepID=A0AAP2D6L7_9BACT|nr:hypothetical protein [Dawidia soli]MBT1685496.1 hypothetical protein [Dawidia soli]
MRKSNESRPNKMVGTLLVLLIAICLQDACTGHHNVYWTFLMVCIISILLLFKYIADPKQQNAVEVEKGVLKKTDIA